MLWWDTGSTRGFIRVVENMLVLCVILGNLGVAQRRKIGRGWCFYKWTFLRLQCAFELLKRGSQELHPLPKPLGVRKSLKIVSHSTHSGKQAADILDMGPQKYFLCQHHQRASKIVSSQNWATGSGPRTLCLLWFENWKKFLESLWVLWAYQEDSFGCHCECLKMLLTSIMILCMWSEVTRSNCSWQHLAISVWRLVRWGSRILLAGTKQKLEMLFNALN